MKGDIIMSNNQVLLFKQSGTYFSKEKNRDIPYCNFFLRINDKMIPIEVKYFPNPNFDNRDPAFSNRKYLLEAVAELLPPRSEASTSEVSTSEK